MVSGNANDQSLELALDILEAGWATVDQLREANAHRRRQRPQIGRLAVALGKLKMAQVFSVLRCQSESGGLFGDVAVAMGLLDQGDLHEILQRQADLTPTLLDSLVALSILSPDQGEFILQQQSNRAAASIAAPLLTGCDL